MKPRTIRAGSCVLLSIVCACGASKSNVGQAPPGASSASAPPPASAASAPPAERPMASTALEAQDLIQKQIDARMKTLWKCVEDLRAKKKDPHREVVVDIGIDQEGNLLGIAAPNPKQGDLDAAFKDCVMSALHGAPFPRSHAGVITVRQTFRDTAVYPQ